MILSGVIPKMAFPRERPGIRFLIPGDVRNARFSRQKKAFSSLSTNNSLFFILSRVTGQISRKGTGFVVFQDIPLGFS
jgi:hypothetical protein